MKRRKIELAKGEIAFALKEGGHWDTHSVAGVWDQTRPVTMEFSATESCIVIPVNSRLAKGRDQLPGRKRQSVEEWLTHAVAKELATSR